MANWYLDYLERARMFPGDFNTPLTPEQVETATRMPAVDRAPKKKPPVMHAPTDFMAIPPFSTPPAMPWSAALERTGEQAAARMGAPLIGAAQGFQDLTGIKPPMMDTAQKILADANAPAVDYDPSYAQQSVISAGGTLGAMLPFMGAGRALSPLLGAAWFGAGEYPEQRRDLDPMQAAASAALTGGIEMLSPSPVPFLRNTGVAGAVKGATGEMGEELLEDVKNQLFRGQQPTVERALDVAEQAAGPIGILSLMGLAGRRQGFPRETEPQQGELPLTGGRGTLAKAAVPKLVAPVATRHHNQTIGSAEGTGSTTDPKTGKRIAGGGYAVGVRPDLTEQVEGEVITPEIVENFIRRNEEAYRKDPGLKFGTWLNTDNNTTYLDAVAIIPDLDTAVQVARNNNEIAIWDLKNKREIRIDYGEREQLPLNFGTPASPVFAMQTPDWKPYKVPGSGHVGWESTEPGGHQIRIMPTLSGKWQIEGYPGAKFPTEEEARARAEQIITSLPTVSPEHKAAALEAQQRYPGGAEADLGVLTEQPRNMGPAASVVEPRAPVRAPQPQAPMTEQEQRIAEQMRRAGEMAQRTVQSYPETQQAQQAVTKKTEATMPKEVEAKLTPLEIKKANYPFPVWDFISKRVGLPNSRTYLPSAKEGDYYGGHEPGVLNRLMNYAANEAPVSYAYTPTQALETRNAVMWLKGTDPDYLNLLLSRAVSAYYGDTTARAMLQMEEAGADKRTKALIEELNMTAEDSPFNKYGGNTEVSPNNAIDQGQQTVRPLGEVPPLIRTTIDPAELAAERAQESIDEYEGRMAAKRQENFPLEVMDPRMDAWITRQFERGMRPDPNGAWAIYENDTDDSRYMRFRNRTEAEDYLRHEQQKLLSVAIDVGVKPNAIDRRAQARAAFAAPYFVTDPASPNFQKPQPEQRPRSEFEYTPRGKFGNRLITDEAVREFFAAAGRYGKFRNDGTGRRWTKGNMEVRANQNFITMYLHGNLIARYDRSNGDLELRDAGWQTPTTKERLNGILDAIGHPGIYQRKFKWYIDDPSGYGSKPWDGSIIIHNVIRGDTGMFAMQRTELPVYNAMNTAEPRAVQPIPPEQMSLPGVGPSQREVKVTGVREPVFTQGTASLLSKVVNYPPGPALSLIPGKGLATDSRRQAAHDLIAKAFDWAKQNGFAAIDMPVQFAEDFAQELQYESFHRGFGLVPNPFKSGNILLASQVEGNQWGAQPSRGEDFEKKAQMPPAVGVSDDFFRQVSPKFDIPTSANLAGYGKFGEIQGSGLRPMSQLERLRVMEMMEGLERRGFPTVLINRLTRIGRGAYHHPGTLAQVDIANDTLSLSEESLRQLVRGESLPETMQSVAHELGHLASIEAAPDAPFGISPLWRSPLFRWDANSAIQYAKTGSAPPSAFGPVMKEVMDVGLKGEGILGEMLGYPVQHLPAYEQAEVFKAEAFAQVWSAYYLFPTELANEMPHTYNLMKELSEYANTSKTFDEWMDRLRVGLINNLYARERKDLLKKEVFKPFQAAFFHQVGGTDIRPVVGKANLTPEQQAFLERFLKGNEERILGARRGVKNAQAIDLEAMQYVEDMSYVAENLGLDLPDLMKKRGGIALSSAELMAGKGLLSEAVRQTKAAANAAAQQNAGEQEVAAFLEQFKGLQILSDEFFKARAEWGRAGQVLQRQAVDFADALNLISKAGGMNSAKDLALMMATLDVSQQAQFAQAMKKKTLGQQAWALWYSFMLSNPKTHIVNLTSNAVYNQWLGLDRLVAAGIGKLHGGDKVYFREMVPTLHGLAQGTLDALNASRDYLVTGGEGGKWDVPGMETEKIGVTNLIPRLMGTGDAFFRSVAFHQELRRRALRQAITEGLKGDALYQREEYLRTHPDEFKEGFRAAERYARKATFTEELGPWAKHLEQMRSVPGAPFAAGITRGTVPFLRTIVNLTKQGARHTPGAAFALPEVRGEWRQGGAARDTAMAEQLTGAGIMTLGWILAELGLATGAEPPDPKEAAAWRMENQPVSIKTGDQWVGLNRIDPLATVLGLGASMPMIAKSEDQVSAALEVIKQLWFSKTWMTGLSDLFGATESYSPQEGETKLFNYAGGLASTLVPAVAGEVARNMDPYARKQSAEGPEGRFMGRVPVLRERLAPAVNVRGEPIERQTFLGPDFLSPFPTKDTTQQDPVLAEMMRVHAVPRTLKGTSKTGKLDPHTASLYQMTARQIAWPILTELIYSDGYLDADPDEQKEMIESVLTKSNAQARREMGLNLLE
jgi:hypothetical protein